MANRLVERDDHWLSIADMMAGLMMIFLFIAISYMVHVRDQKEKITQIAVTYNRLQNDLHVDLFDEFKTDLDRWGATVDDQTLVVRFAAPEVLFEKGEAAMREEFKQILSDFFPRYIAIIAQERYRGDIEEIRIEGHTSSEWNFSTTPDSAYIYNMKLSQDRTRSVLEYVLSLPQIEKDRKWVKEYLTANGLSSSKPIMENGQENREVSRRVEFRVRTNAERRIVRILEEGG